VAFESSVEVTPVNADDPAQIARSTEAGVTTTVARTVEVTPAVVETPNPRSFNDVDAKDDEANTRARVAASLRGDPDIVLTPEEERYLEQQTQQINRQNSAVYDQAPPVNPNADDGLRTPGGAIEGGVQAETGLAEPPNVDAEDDTGLRTPTGEIEGGVTAETGLAEPPDVDPNQDAAFGPLRTPDGAEETGAVAETGLREPTAEDVAAAEQNAAKLNAINQATRQSRYKQPGNTDWRVRLSLAPTSDYLYNAGGNDPNAAGILAPLRTTNGVVFPYTPTVSTSYQANYEQYDLVHSNYRGLYYKNSRVGDISVRGLFTAQDTTEANYLLAVIHFFRSVTKMFYGQDANRGVPPPLVFLSGFGNFQFSDHPCVVAAFNYTLPNDVDYIRATNFNNYGGNLFNRRQPIATAPGGVQFAGAIRLANALLPKGAQPQVPTQNTLTASVTNTDRSTYVPTKMEIDISLIPVQTRDQVSNQFSLKEFANGNLIKKGFW